MRIEHQGQSLALASSWPLHSNSNAYSSLERGGAWLQIPAKLVKELRMKSGAGMMDCKRALAASNGDLDSAADYLRKKGLASADKKAGRIASEGAISSYIHGGRLAAHAQ